MLIKLISRTHEEICSLRSCHPLDLLFPDNFKRLEVAFKRELKYTLD